jgi:GAF domain-containing protein
MTAGRHLALAVRGLALAVSELADTLAHDIPISDGLTCIAHRARAILEVDYAGLWLQELHQLRCFTAIDERFAHLEQGQESGQAGPCVEAWRSRALVAAPDLRGSVHDGWDRFQSAARGAGVLAVAAVPLRSGDHSLGALGLYSLSTRAWSAGDLLVAEVLANLASGFYVDASEQSRQERLARQLQEAISSRPIIEQAKGVLAAERGISVGQAFEVIRRHARDRGASLRAVASSVVRTGYLP